MSTELSGRGPTIIRACRAFGGVIAFCMIYGIPFYFYPDIIKGHKLPVFICIMVYLMYHAFAYKAQSNKFMVRLLGLNALFRDIQDAIKAAPICQFKISCYHYLSENNFRSGKVVTHSAVKDF